MNRAFGMLRRLATLALGKSKAKRVQAAMSGGKLADLPSTPALNGDAMEVDESTEADADNLSLGKTKDRGPRQNGDLQAEADERRQIWEGINSEILPNQTFVLGALNMTDMDVGILKDLVALASLDE